MRRLDRGFLDDGLGDLLLRRERALLLIRRGRRRFGVGLTVLVGLTLLSSDRGSGTPGLLLGLLGPRRRVVGDDDTSEALHGDERAGNVPAMEETVRQEPHLTRRRRPARAARPVGSILLLGVPVFTRLVALNLG